MRTAYDIKWDTDGDEELAGSLPKRMNIPAEIQDEDVADYLSDQTGFCHFGFQLRDDAPPKAAGPEIDPVKIAISYDSNFVSIQGTDDSEPHQIPAGPSEAYNLILSLVKDELDDAVKDPDE